jgi:glycosyltransferase involved in cell wall biosynthesis
MIKYNHEKHIAEAINKVFTQKYDFDIEFIIANDKSKDQTNLKLVF